MNTEKLERKIAELAQGDGSAFDYIYGQTNRSVYFAVLYIVKDKMYAEDILQETYVRAIKNLSQYRRGSNFAGWLIAIGRSIALNHVKRASREVPTDFDAQAYRYGETHTELPFIFDVAAKVLEQDEYEILMLCQVAGYKRREVADMLEMPIGTVTWKNNRALEKLRQYLEKEGANEG